MNLQEKASEDDLKKIVKEYFDRWFNLEGEMFFLQREVILRDLQVTKSSLVPLKNLFLSFIKHP
jgi:hypothetical protein